MKSPAFSAGELYAHLLEASRQGAAFGPWVFRLVQARMRRESG